MKIFQKTFVAVFSCVLLIIVLLSYVLANSHIDDSEKGLIEQNRIYGKLISKQIEVGYLQSDWPYETLNDLSKRDAFKFWWVVKGDGTIYRSDNVSFIRTNAYDYFPQLKNQTNFDNTIYSNNDNNYAIYFKSFQYGSEVWTIWVGFSLDEISRTTTNIIITIALAVISVLIILSVILYVLVKSFTNPMVKLWKTVSEVANGNFDTSSDIHSNDEIGQLASELNIMIKNMKDSRSKIEEYSKKLEKLLKQKDEFIGQLSHDLKTPLTPLNALLPIIRKREQDPHLIELLDVTIRNVNYTNNLVENTLQLARLNSPNVVLAMTDFSLSSEIKIAIEHNQCNLEKTGIIVKSNLDDSIIMTADPLQIKELIDNLLSNAIKYTPHGGKITINTVQERDFVVTTIQDTGVGLSIEQLEHLFEEFYKADSSRHDLESTGLGLSICKRIVEKHGGKIWAESKGLGKGTTFYFTIPKSQKNAGIFVDNNEMHKNIDALLTSKKIGTPSK